MIKLIVHLTYEGIYTLGTIRHKIIPNNKIPSEKEIEKKERGTPLEIVAAVEGVEIRYFTWKHNKQVNLLSKLAGKLLELKIKRFYRKNKQDVNIDFIVII